MDNKNDKKKFTNHNKETEKVQSRPSCRRSYVYHRDTTALGIRYGGRNPHAPFEYSEFGLLHVGHADTARLSGAFFGHVCGVLGIFRGFYLFIYIFKLAAHGVLHVYAELCALCANHVTLIECA